MVELSRKFVHLPELSVFSEVVGIKPGEQVDLLLARTKQPVCCMAVHNNISAAAAYRQVLMAGGKMEQEISIEEIENPISVSTQFERQGVIPLVINNATDPTLKDGMFVDGPDFGQLFMSHLYLPRGDHQSPDLFAAGIGKKELSVLNRQNMSTQVDPSMEKKMAQARREILGESVMSNDDFRRILRSGSVNTIIAHALGPVGTNISQAMEQYLEAVGVRDKTQLIIHPKGIEPVEYAEMAASQIRDGVIPIHMECAVYYDMGKLFNLRTGEVVFADHHYMPLDAMQLASIKELEELAQAGVMKIAAHPSPQPLIHPWITQGKAQWIPASSNSAAAALVISGEADACITTASSLKGKDLLKTRHLFGSPMMLFTIGTSLRQEQLKVYLEKL